jgi:hypothetical protein
MIIITTVILLSIAAEKTKNKAKTESLKKEIRIFSSPKEQKSVIRIKNTNRVSCPPSEPDDSTCTDQAAAVSALSTVVIGDYDGDDVETAVNNYLIACKASQCQPDCETLVANKDLAVFASFDFVNFNSKCKEPSVIIKTGIVPSCNASLTDNQTICNTSYHDVIGNLTAAAWDATLLNASISNFVTACPTTSCKTNCSAVISGKNITLKYTSLNTSFQGNCKPVPPGSPSAPNNNSGFRMVKSSTLLIGISTAVAIIHLLLEQ